MNYPSTVHIKPQVRAARRATHDHRRVSGQIDPNEQFSSLIGNSFAMQKVYHMVSLVAESDATVLLLGETGTGKSLVADAIHRSSSRKNKAMIKVNCAAIPAALMESELFGHERGAFTGALERRIGKFELANNSTLFLDEIGEMPLEMQAKLLRALQDREIERLGGTTSIKVNTRIITATNRSLQEEVRAGRFRADLYYRLNVFPLVLPPLRDRMEDIKMLADFFLARFSRHMGRNMIVSPGVVSKMKRYTWPGNVRELEHTIERSVLLSTGNVLEEIQLPAGEEVEDDPSDLINCTLAQVERKHIVMTLKRCHGKIAGDGGAASILKVPSTTLHSKMKKLGISKTDYNVDRS